MADNQQAQPIPPGPWEWRDVTAETSPGTRPGTEPSGQALVASDGTWLISTESGSGTPDVHPAIKGLLARAWVLRPPVEPGQYASDCDLNMLDDQNNNWTLLARAGSSWDPTVIYPGAILRVGRPGADSNVEVLRTELFLTRTRGIMILVTFRQLGVQSLEDALTGT